MAAVLRTFIAPSAVFAALLGSGTGALGQEPVPPSKAEPEVSAGISLDMAEIIVPGERPLDEEALDAATGDISMRGRLSYRPIPRYNFPLCLHVAGLADPAANQKIKTRIEEHATLLGIALAGEWCKVNAQIVLVADPTAFITGYRKQQPWVFGADADRTIRSALKRKAPAIVWFNSILMPFDQAVAGPITAPVGRVDVPLVGAFGVPTSLIGGGGFEKVSPLQIKLVRNRLNGTIVFDTTRLKGYTIRQVADYAAMRLFGNTQPKVAFSQGEPLSILSMFEAGPASAAPGMTLLDRAYLQGIYRLKPYAHPAELERSVRIAYGGMREAVCTQAGGCQGQGAAITPGE